MSRADYAHWNEEADRIWWEEEGRHADGPDLSYDQLDAESDALDAFWEEVEEMEDEQILAHLCDADYRRRWPKAVTVLQTVAEDRGIV